MVWLERQQETGGTQLAAVPKGIIVLLGQEFHADLGVVEMGLTRSLFWLTGCHYILFFDHTQWDPERHWLCIRTFCI